MLETQCSASGRKCTWLQCHRLLSWAGTSLLPGEKDEILSSWHSLPFLHVAEFIYAYVIPLQLSSSTSRYWKVTGSPSLSRLNNLNSFSLSTAEVLQPSDHLQCAPLDSLQQVHTLLMLGIPKLNAVLLVASHQSRAWVGENHFLWPYWTHFGSLGYIWLSGLQVHSAESCWTSWSPTPQLLLPSSVLNPFSTQPVSVAGIALTHI